MTFTIGDKVSVLDEDISGIVVAVKSPNVTLETEDGFHLEFPESQLVVIPKTMSLKDADAFNSLAGEKIKEDVVGKKRQKPSRSKERYQPPMEVDLHIHQLVSTTKHMSKHDILNYQLDTARRQLEFAIRKRIQRIVFIHGVGEGVLKTELDYLLSRYDNITHYDADYQKYGLGATEAYIYQNPK